MKEKKRPGCLVGCLSVIVLFFAILLLSYACSGGSKNNSNDEEQKAQEVVEEVEGKENTAQYQSYADQAKGYFHEITEIANNLKDSGQTNMDDVTSAYEELADRISKTAAEIPEDTDDHVLRIERSMFEQLSKIALLPTAMDLTGADMDEFNETLNKNIAEYKTLTEQIPEYYSQD